MEYKVTSYNASIAHKFAASQGAKIVNTILQKKWAKFVVQHVSSSFSIHKKSGLYFGGCIWQNTDSIFQNV